MKTLVIHPKDPTTDVLSKIYQDEKWTITKNEIRPNMLERLIKEHDRIVMLGHGCGIGMLGFKKLYINGNHAHLLKDKECICIWCHADKYFQYFKLKGFYTGMIISEYFEAMLYLNEGQFTQEQITVSNELFVKAIAASKNDRNMLTNVLNIYKQPNDQPHNPILYFNRCRMYISDNSLYN